MGNLLCVVVGARKHRHRRRPADDPGNGPVHRGPSATYEQSSPPARRWSTAPGHGSTARLVLVCCVVAPSKLSMFNALCTANNRVLPRVIPICTCCLIPTNMDETKKTKVIENRVQSPEAYRGHGIVFVHMNLVKFFEGKKSKVDRH